MPARAWPRTRANFPLATSGSATGWARSRHGVASCTSTLPSSWAVARDFPSGLNATLNVADMTKAKEFLAAVRVPDLEFVVRVGKKGGGTRRHHAAAIGVEGHAANFHSVPAQRDEFRAAGHIPDLHRVVRTR